MQAIPPLDYISFLVTPAWICPRANADCVGVFQKLALRVEDQSITAIEYGEGRKRLEDGIEPLRPHPVLQKHVASYGGERCGFAIEFFAHPGEDETQIVMADAGGYRFPAAAHLFKEQALGELHSVGKVIEFLLALANNFHDAGKGAVLGEFGQGLTSHQQAVTHGAANALVESRGVVFDFLARADHQFGCGRGRRSAEVGDEIDDGEIGFMANSGNNRNL
jgi:hypothetical protein